MSTTAVRTTGYMEWQVAAAETALAKALQECDTYRAGLQALWYGKTVWMVAEQARRISLDVPPEDRPRHAAIEKAADLLMAWTAEQAQAKDQLFEDSGGFIDKSPDPKETRMTPYDLGITEEE